ncbi:unnamed protein product [Rotaria sordida]|uniref:Uncharacterized protein n=1 Tax=Rotaria sordida TaxID=392033 RepID=A0A814HH93_9BILA|nr:unnamed protein product [Rotaria sordida]
MISCLAYLQCQNELNNHQNHYIIKRKKQSEEIDLLRSTLIQHDIKLQQFINNETKLLVKQLKLEHKIKLLEQNNIKLKSNREKSLRNQTAQLDDSNHAQNEFSTSEQSKQSLATELGTLKYKYAKLEESIYENVQDATKLIEESCESKKHAMNQIKDTKAYSLTVNQSIAQKLADIITLAH